MRNSKYLNYENYFTKREHHKNECKNFAINCPLLDLGCEQEKVKYLTLKFSSYNRIMLFTDIQI